MTDIKENIKPDAKTESDELELNTDLLKDQQVEVSEEDLKKIRECDADCVGCKI